MYSQSKNHSLKNSKEIKMENQNALSTNVCFIDKFYVPKNSVEEFKQKMNINRKFIKSIVGYLQVEAFEQVDEKGNLTIITIATWENQNYLDNAKLVVQAEFKKNNFNPVEFYEKLNIKLERGLYNKIME